MENFVNALFAWNAWIVFPALAMAALVLHIRRRKHSTLLLFLGLLAHIAGRLLTMASSQSPPHLGYIIGLIAGAAGLVTAIVGAIWFVRKDYGASATQE